MKESSGRRLPTLSKWNSKVVKPSGVSVQSGCGFCWSSSKGEMNSLYRLTRALVTVCQKRGRSPAWRCRSCSTRTSLLFTYPAAPLIIYPITSQITKPRPAWRDTQCCPPIARVTYWLSGRSSSIFRGRQPIRKKRKWIAWWGRLSVCGTRRMMGRLRSRNRSCCRG